MSKRPPSPNPLSQEQRLKVNQFNRRMGATQAPNSPDPNLRTKLKKQKKDLITKFKKANNGNNSNCEGPSCTILGGRRRRRSRRRR